jgi:two-component system, OmpR family, response regulator MtrA
VDGYVLVVEDDDASIREVTALGLTRAGLRVHTAVDGRDALSSWRTRCASPGACFDLIIVDVMLPGLDGFEVCREIRRRPSTPGSRVHVVDIPVALVGFVPAAR